MQLKNHAVCTIFHERIIEHHRRKNTCSSQMKPLLGLALCRVFLFWFLVFFLSSPYTVSAVKPGQAQKSIGIVPVGIGGIWLGAQTFLNCGNSDFSLQRKQGLGMLAFIAQTAHPAVALNCCSPSLWLPQQHLAKI